jgi:hypothetical protein
MPVRVLFFPFLCNALAPHHDDEDDATKDALQSRQTYIQQMFLREILSFYKSFCAALSSSSALAVVGSNSGENLKGG